MGTGVAPDSAMAREDVRIFGKGKEALSGLPGFRRHSRSAVCGGRGAPEREGENPPRLRTSPYATPPADAPAARQLTIIIDVVWGALSLESPAADRSYSRNNRRVSVGAFANPF